MPIESPQLDDLRFDTVSTQLRREIALYAPEWTDHNDSDPGITLLQLFAHLGEQIGYRLNRLPDKTYVEMLKLIGVRLRPAIPSTTLLAFFLAKPEAAVAFAIDEASRVKAKSKLTPPPTFETVAPTDAVPGQVAALVTTRSDELRDISYGGAVLADTGDVTKYIAERFSVTWDGRQPKLKDWPETPVHVFSRTSEDTHVNLWIGLAFNPLPSAGFIGQRVTLHIQVDDDELPSAKDLADCALDMDALAEALAPPVEMFFYQPPQPPAMTEGSWQPLRVIADTTNGFTRSGAIKLDVPLTIGPIPNGEWKDVRAPQTLTTVQLCASASGTPKPLPPPVKHPLIGALKTPVGGTPSDVPVSGWLAIRFPAKPAGFSIRTLTFNAARAVAATTQRNELVATGTGRSDQVVQLSKRNVLEETLEIIVQDIVDGQFHRFTRVDDFDTSGPDDRVFVLDAEAGLVYFGDGRRGRVPALGARIVTPRFRWTDGTTSDLAVGTVTLGENLPSFIQDVTNVVPARGGRGAETLDEAKRRAPRQLKAFGRAVTAEDFELFARQTPEARIAKAVVIPLRRPYTAEGIDRAGIDIARVAPGAISVVVVPEGDGRFLAPTEGVLRAVCRYLNKFRLVTTELYVAAPQYVRIYDLVITVVPKPGYTVTKLREAITLRLEGYLHVLSGGPEGDGFGFGTTLHHAELVAQVFRVDGVDRVERLDAKYKGDAPDAVPPMIWRDERQQARNLVGCPSGPLDDERIVLFPDETVVVDTATLNVIVQDG